MLARKDVDGVIVSTPDHWHVPLAVYAARAGEDMYVEKPLGVAMAWAWKLREEVAKHQVVFQYGTQQRGDQRQFRRACELVRNGYVGQVQRVDAWGPDMSVEFQAASLPPYGSTQPIDVPADLDYEMWIGPAGDEALHGRPHDEPWGLPHLRLCPGAHRRLGRDPLDIAQWGLDMDTSGAGRYQGTGTIPPRGSLWDSIESWDVQCEYASGVKMHFMGSRVAAPVVKAYHRAWSHPRHDLLRHRGVDQMSTGRRLYASDKTLQNAKVKPEEVHLCETTSQARNFVDCELDHLRPGAGRGEKEAGRADPQMGPERRRHLRGRHLVDGQAARLEDALELGGPRVVPGLLEPDHERSGHLPALIALLHAPVEAEPLPGGIVPQVDHVVEPRAAEPRGERGRHHAGLGVPACLPTRNSSEG